MREDEIRGAGGDRLKRGWILVAIVLAMTAVASAVGLALGLSGGGSSVGGASATVLTFPGSDYELELLGAWFANEAPAYRRAPESEHFHPDRGKIFVVVSISEDRRPATAVQLVDKNGTIYTDVQKVDDFTGFLWLGKHTYWYPVPIGLVDRGLRLRVQLGRQTGFVDITPVDIFVPQT